MFLLRGFAALILTAGLVAPAATGATATKKAPAHKAASASGSARKHKGARRTPKPRGQLAIQPARVVEIQKALIREHYLSGEADGKWEGATEAAMQKYQADQGWQTKLMPDPRAIKKLGLGPDYSGAINAKNSTFGDPPPVSTIPADQAAGFAQGAGVNR